MADKEGSDVYDNAMDVLTVLATTGGGAAIGKKIAKNKALKEFWPKAGKKSREANLKQYKHDTKNFEKEYHQNNRQKDSPWLMDEIKRRKRNIRRLEGRGGMIGGAAVGAPVGIGANRVRKERD